ncbi:MAG: acyl-ACP thioesterase domain-containing protein [Bacteroidota bacterium]
MASSFQKEFMVSSYELNPRGEARLTTMANYFQEIAYHHANELGFGYEDMKNRKTMWLLSRMKIRMKKYPVWDDRITIETWPSGVDKLFAVRDFRVMNKQGEEIGAASTGWLIVDLNTHRPIKPKEELDAYARIIYGAPVFDGSLEKIRLPDQLEELNRHRVLYSDLDIVGHVNNVKYMEWSIDTAMFIGNREKEIHEFEINFMKETKFGDMITISGSPGMVVSANGSHHVLVGIREEDGAEAFRSLIRWDDHGG